MVTHGSECVFEPLVVFWLAFFLLHGVGLGEDSSLLWGFWVLELLGWVLVLVFDLDVRGQFFAFLVLLAFVPIVALVSLLIRLFLSFVASIRPVLVTLSTTLVDVLVVGTIWVLGFLCVLFRIVFLRPLLVLLLFLGFVRLAFSSGLTTFFLIMLLASSVIAILLVTVPMISLPLVLIVSLLGLLGTMFLSVLVTSSPAFLALVPLFLIDIISQLFAGIVVHFDLALSVDPLRLLLLVVTEVEAHASTLHLVLTVVILIMRLPLFVFLILKLARVQLLLFRPHSLRHLLRFQINLRLNIAILDKNIFILLEINHNLLLDFEVICIFELNVLSR